MAKAVLLLCCLMMGALADEKILQKFGQLKQEVSLECKGDEGDVITWTRPYNGTASSELVDGEDANIEIEGTTLKILSLGEDDLGGYSCLTNGNPAQTFELKVKYRLKKMAVSVSVDVGESTKDKIKCVVTGDTEVAFLWYTRPEDDPDREEVQVCGVENDNCLSQEPPAPEETKNKVDETTTVGPLKDRLTIKVEKDEDGNQVSVLGIENAQLEDRAFYVCKIVAQENLRMSADGEEKDENAEESLTLLRVKDPLAAVWPFVGIVVEVVVLCLVIFICERRKKDDDKDDMDEDGYTGNNVSSNNSLRQRK